MTIGVLDISPATYNYLLETSLIIYLINYEKNKNHYWDIDYKQSV